MPSIERLKASDGTGNASVATITSDRAALASTLLVDTTQGIPDSFMATMGTPHTFIDPITNEEITTISEESAVDFAGHVDGSNLEIDTIAPGYTDAGSAIGDIVIIRPTTQWADEVAAVLGVSLNDNGTLKAVTQSPGYVDLPVAPNSVTDNGNRNYSLVFPGVDLTSALSKGMRLKITRTVTAPTQCADLESSSSQYFNKTSPAGTTFTDDFCAGAWIKLESYTGADQTIISRYNGTSGWHMSINQYGQVNLAGYNGGSGNVSYVVTYQSIPLNKWVHIAAQLDMSAFTATTTTSYVMIDGVDAACQVSRAGTNPTALVQAGNLEVGSRNGGTTPFDGKLAQVFYTSAKVTQANMRLLRNQGVTAALVSAHSIVSAWSLSNSLTDINTTNANNLTAQNSAVATATDSPFAGGNVQEFTDGTVEFGIIMKDPVFSTDTTVVVQVPEGYALPTSGGISAASYSISKVPYGFPSQRSKWQISVDLIASMSSTTISASNTTTVYPAVYGRLTVPIGEWTLGFRGFVEVTTSSATSNFAVFGGLYNITTSKLIGTAMRAQNGASTNYAGLTGTIEAHIANTSEAIYTFAAGGGWTGSGAWYTGQVGSVSGPVPSYTVYADCAYL